MSWLKSLGARARLLFAPRAAESRMEEEMRFHLEMEAERLVREEGLEAGEARRRASVSFGGRDRYREEMREERGLAWLSGLRLDVKLGARMLLKYPVLTVASVLALAVAVTLAVSWFEFMTDVTRPRLQLPDADRIVQVRNRDVAAAANRPTSVHDLETWRDEVESIEDLSAGTPVEYTLTTEDGRVATVEGMRVTPSMFRLVRLQPVVGRSLTESDVAAGAAPVAVIGYSAWQRLFDGDRSAIGQTVRLGSEYATVVGVMPEGFGFPVNEEIWTPLRESALDYERGDGPGLMMVGRLPRGARLEEARAELAVIGQRTAAAFPDTHEHLRPDVNRFGRGSDMAGPAALLNLPFLFFLLVVSANVATLLFARTASRESEIALRSALGASRRRIILQLVAEALVLMSVAAALGLAAAHWGLGWGMDLFFEVQQTSPPFWFDSGLSAPSVLYVVALAGLGALIIGGIPGLRATRRQLRDRLPQPGAGGSGMRFGAIATGVIIVQVALCVAFIPVAIMNGQDLLEETRATEFPAEEFLSGRLTRQADPSAGARRGPAGPLGDERAVDLFDDAQRRLTAEPGVLAATRASRLPGFNHPVEAVEIEGDSARIVEARRVAVDPDFFDVVGARIVNGRSLRPDDVTNTFDVAVVDQVWAQAIFDGQSPLGRRIRYPGQAGEGAGERAGEQASGWYEIVGVVEGVERAIGPGTVVRIFHPLRPEEHASVQIYLRTAGDPDALLPQVHTLVTSVDPDLGITDLMPLDDVWRPVERANVFFTAALGVVAAIILLFAMIGIYALMSFTVAKRAREIGIRAALGADPQSIVLAIFSRAMGQIGLGVVAGAVLVSLTLARSPDGLRLVGGVAAAMVAVGLLGCVVPAMRALRIQPTEALRAE